MGKLKKVLLLVVALCVMISIMGIAATAGDTPVAQIGEETYTSLADAIAAVPTDGTATTITMIADSVETGTITIASTKNIVLDLNGHTVSYTENASGKSVYFITNKGMLTIKDTSANGNGNIIFTGDPFDNGYSKETVTIYNLDGTLNLQSGKITNASAGGLAYAVNNSSNAWGANVISTFNMTGGVLSAPSGDAALRVYQNGAGTDAVTSRNIVTISGGTILDTGIFLDNYIYSPSVNTTGSGILTSVTISGGTINGLIDLKLRHPFNTSLNITGGTFVDSKLWVRKVGSEWSANVAEPTDPMVHISDGTWSFVTGKAFGLSYDCGATSWTSYTQPYSVTGGVFNVDLNNYSGIKFESGETGVANSGANKATYPYTVGVAVAQIGETKYTSLYDAALAVQNSDTITMIADTLETNEVKFDFNGSATLDLNGHTVATNNDIWIKTGNLTVVGSEGSKVTSLGDNSNGYGFYVSTNSLENNVATLTIDSDNVTVDAEKYGVVLMKNGVFNLENGHIVSHSNTAVSGNGTAPNVTVNISGGSIESSRLAIYFPATASLNITGGTITGTTAIYQKCGTLTISGGMITATGAATEYSYNGNGANATGDAIVIDNCGYPGGAPSASISGATITSTNGKQIGYYVNGTSAEGTVRADSAYTLNTNTEKEWVADTSVTGYSYRIATPTYVAQIGTTKYTSLADAIAAANADTTSNSITITLLEDIDFSTGEYADYKWAATYNPLTITRSNVTIDLDGHTISEMGNAALVFGNILANDGRIANITIKNGTLRAGKTDNVTNSYVLGIAGVDGALVKNVTTMGGINVYTGSKNVVIESCNVAGTKYYTVCAQCGSDVTIKGTTYTKNTDSTVANKSMFWIQGAGTDSDMETTENPTGAFGTSSITIESGNFTVDTSNGGVFYLSSGVKPIVKGGYFNIDPTACVAQGYSVVESDLEGYTHKVEQTKVAQIGETKYTSLADAVSAVSEGGTIVLLTDITFDENYSVPVWEKAFNLDLGGHTLTTNSTVDIAAGNGGYKASALCWSLGSAGSKPITITNGTIRTAYGAGIYVDDPAIVATLSGLTINANTVGVQTTAEYSTAIRLTYEAEAIIESGSYAGNYVIAVSNSGGIVTINGGTFTGDIFFSGYTDSGKEKSITINGGNFAGTFVNPDKGTLVIKGGYFTANPTAYVAQGYSVEAGTYVVNNVTYNYKVVQYVEQSTTNTTTTTIDDNTTTTTTTDLATSSDGTNTQYVIKIETTTTVGSADPATTTTYTPVNVDVTSNNNVDEHVAVTAENITASGETIANARQTVEAVTGQTATFVAKLDENEASSANVLKTTAAANAIAKAAATVSAEETATITDAKIELKTTLKSYTLADGTNSSVKATKVVYEIKPVAVLYKIENEVKTQLGEAVELDNADINAGETFTFTIPVPANMTATTVKVSHIGTDGYSTEIGTYTPSAPDANGIRYITVTVDHFSKFELEESVVDIDGNCVITASISLKDSIDINFYVKNIAEGTSLSDYEVRYTFNGVETVVPGNEWIPANSGSYKFVVASCAAKQINDTVTFEVLYNGVRIKEVDSYSIRQYCVNKINANSDQKLVEICRAVLDYGAAAQNYFNYNTENLANDGGYGLTSKEESVPNTYNIVSATKASDVTKLSATLSTVSKTEINFYVTTDYMQTVKVTLNNNDVSNIEYGLVEGSNNVYKITVKGIAARNLDNVYVLKVTTSAGETTVTYSALAYTYRKQDSSLSESGLSLAIYNYYMKAAAYFG